MQISPQPPHSHALTSAAQSPGCQRASGRCCSPPDTASHGLGVWVRLAHSTSVGQAGVAASQAATVDTPTYHPPTHHPTPPTCRYASSQATTFHSPSLKR